MNPLIILKGNTCVLKVDRSWIHDLHVGFGKPTFVLFGRHFVAVNVVTSNVPIQMNVEKLWWCFLKPVSFEFWSFVVYAIKWRYETTVRSSLNKQVFKPQLRISYGLSVLFSNYATRILAAETEKYVHLRNLFFLSQNTILWLYFKAFGSLDDTFISLHSLQNIVLCTSEFCH